MVDDYTGQVAEGMGLTSPEDPRINAQLAAEGVLDVEQLSMAEKVELADIRAQEGLETQRRLAEREAAETPEARRAAAGYEMREGRLVKIGEPKEGEPEFEQKLAAEIGAEEPTAAAAPAQTSLEEYRATMREAAELGRRRPSRIVETPAKPVLEREQAEVLEAKGREQLAELRGAAIEAEGMQSIAQIEQETHDQLRDMQTQEATNEFERQQYVGQEKQKLDGAIDRYRTGQMRDPWADRTTGTKIKDGIALALGAVGSALIGGENVAMSIINTALDSDMESQRANIGIAGAAVGMQESALQDSMRITGDARIAELHARESMLEAIKYKLRQQAAATGSQQVMNNASRTIAQMDQQIATLRAQQDLGIQQMGYAKVGGDFELSKEQRALGMKLLEKGFETGEKMRLEEAKGLSAGERGGLSAKEFDTARVKYGERRSDSYAAKRMVRDFLNDFETGDIPGFKAAWLDPRTKFSILSEEARETKQTVGMIIDRYRKAITGAQAAEKELAIIEGRIYGGNTINDLRHGLRKLEAQMDFAAENIDATTNEAVVEAVRKREYRPEEPSPESIQSEFGGSR